MRLVDPAPTLTLPEAVAGLATAPDPTDYYRTFLFPHAVARFRDLGERRPSATLLMLPVGTQPYAPLLSALANPAAHLALLVTPQTRGYAAEVAACFPDAASDLFEIGDGTSGEALCRAVDAALAFAADPWPTEVVVDVTGGRKATTAQLGAIAALRGFRTVYVEGQPLGSTPWMHQERLVDPADVAALLQEEHRVRASAYLEIGAWDAATAALDRVLATTFAGPIVTLWKELLDLRDDPAAVLARLARVPSALVAAGQATLPVDAPFSARAARLLADLRAEGVWR